MNLNLMDPKLAPLDLIAGSEPQHRNRLMPKTHCKRQGWRGRRARWNGLYSAEALAEQKRVRELLARSRELLKQMQAG
jgi:hypothetical protein